MSQLSQAQLFEFDFCKINLICDYQIQPNTSAATPVIQKKSSQPILTAKPVIFCAIIVHQLTFI